jgi:hypothetical protein
LSERQEGEVISNFWSRFYECERKNTNPLRDYAGDKPIIELLQTVIEKEIRKINYSLLRKPGLRSLHDNIVVGDDHLSQIIDKIITDKDALEKLNKIFSEIYKVIDELSRVSSVQALIFKLQVIDCKSHDYIADKLGGLSEGYTRKAMSNATDWIEDYLIAEKINLDVKLIVGLLKKTMAQYQDMAATEKGVCSYDVDRVYAYALGETGKAEEAEVLKHIYRCYACFSKVLWIRYINQKKKLFIKEIHQSRQEVK